MIKKPFHFALRPLIKNIDSKETLHLHNPFPFFYTKGYQHGIFEWLESYSSFVKIYLILFFVIFNLDQSTYWKNQGREKKMKARDRLRPSHKKNSLGAKKPGFPLKPEKWRI